MKNLFSLMVIIFLSTALFAQVEKRRMTDTKCSQHDSPAKHARIGIPAGPMKPNSVFFYDDFSNPAAWTLTHGTGTTDDWVIGPNPPSGVNFIDPIMSSSSINGWALFDSDALCSHNQDASLTTATPINCTGHSNIRLTFQEYFRHFLDSTFVLVSNNGNTWTKFIVNAGLDPNQFNRAHRSMNPCEVAVDISSVAANQDSVYIRFQFYSPNTLGANAGCCYSWQIDDVTLSDIADIDARPYTPVLSGDYTEIPVLDEQAFQLRGKIVNYGTQPITGARIYFTIIDQFNNQIYSDTSVASGTIQPDDTSGFLAAASGHYTLPDTGVYAIDHSIILQGDTETWNDIARGFVYYNDSTYARDFAAIDGDLQNSLGFGNGGSGLMGQKFHVYHNSSLTSGSFYLTSPTVGATVQLKLYNIGGTVPVNMMAHSAVYTITANDSINNNIITLPFTAPLHVPPGDYFLAVHQLDGNFLNLATTDQIYNPLTAFYKATSSTQWNPLESLGFKYSFLLRLNNPSDSTLDVNEIDDEASLNVFPNPAKGFINIVIMGPEEKDIMIKVVNSLGQVMKSEFYKKLSAVKLDLSDLAKGNYTVNIVTKEREINKTVVLE